MNPRFLTVMAALAVAPLMSSAQDAAKSAAAPAPAPSGDPMASVPLDKVSYFIGRDIGGNMGSQGFKPDYDALKQGLQDAVEKKASKYTDDELKGAMEKFQAAMQAKETQRAAESAKKSEAFLTENGKKKGVTTTASGLQYEVITAGEGPKPAATDTVKVHYKGTLVNGEEFDSSYSRNEPAEFPLNGVIPGWTEGVQLMSKGSKFKFVIPGKLAYGENGSPPKIGPNE
ncbi:MAG: FKBP-type peptidyl-prolyl cis-trans isomerase N-terminal domain-containing protein, partial [Verrucomicrobiaceae bacterium]